jgi:ubiquinone/menaquinone biosynthesis C-methylase UbiE
MFKDGFQNIISTDISEEVCKQMQEKISKYKSLSYIVDDVFNMKFENGTFDVVIDKALLDSILCKENANQDADKMVKEVYRVLGKRGKFICISHNHERSTYFKTQDWDIEANPLSLKDLVDGESSKGKKDKKSNKQNEKAEHYLYIMTKP